MGQVLGADPDALEALAAQFTRRAAMVEDRRSAVTGMLALVVREVAGHLTVARGRSARPEKSRTRAVLLSR